MAEVANKLVGACAIGINTAAYITVNIVVSAGSNRPCRAYFRQHRSQSIKQIPSPTRRLDGYKTIRTIFAVAVSLRTAYNSGNTNLPELHSSHIIAAPIRQARLRVPSPRACEWMRGVLYRAGRLGRMQRKEQVRG